MIKYWDRKDGCEKVEKVYGEEAMRWLYSTKMGSFFTGVATSHWVSRIYGALQSSSMSQKKIKPFIKNFEIDMSLYEEENFTSFNDFFIRKFKPGQRSFVSDAEVLPAFAEGRYLGFEKITPDLRFPVKGSFLSALALTGDLNVAKDFHNGPLLIARLCPVDYHRFHYPDEGLTAKVYRLSGDLYSVNPVALERKSDIFASNERVVSILETKNFGKLAYIEVGATMVGRIVQSYEPQSFKRGDEKGYFLFGGSTVILMGQPGKWVPDADILSRTSNQMETLLRLGESVAHKIVGK